MPLKARRFVRKMRGGAQSHLLEAEGGCYYVVKFLNNPQGRRILVNELLAERFLRYLQLEVPQTTIIAVTPEFLEANPEVGLESAAGKIPVQPGWHFGSRYPGDPSRTAVYDFLPDALLKQVGNVTDFLGMLVADKWMANADGRQSIYFRARWASFGARGSQVSRTGFLTQMVDHGFMFHGPQWEYQDSPYQGLAMRPAVYATVRSWADLQPWLDQIVHFPEEIVDQARKSVPPEWLNGDESNLDQLLERLLRRRSRVPDLLTETRRSRPGLFPNWH